MRSSREDGGYPRFIGAREVPIGGRYPAAMAFDPVLFRQLPFIQKIIADETWLEAERRGCAVAPEDPVVRARVCEVVLQVGAALRQMLTVDAADAPQKVPFPSDDHSHAA